MSNDNLDLCDRSRSLKNRRQEGPVAIQNYSKVNQAIRGKLKQAKENWISDRCQEIDYGITTGNSKAAFNTLKLLAQRQQTKTNVFENAKGKLLTYDKALHKRWTEYCTELYNYKPKTDVTILRSGDDVENRETGDSPIFKEELEKSGRDAERRQITRC